MRIREDITEFLGRHPRLRFVLRTLKRINNRQFVHDVNALYNNRFMPVIEERGEKNRGRILYLIDEKYGYFGFCTVLREALEGLLICEDTGYVPVIAVTPNWIYAEEGEFLNTTNPWEYYFTQPANISLSEFNSSFRTIKMTRDDVLMIATRYKNRGHLVSKEYIEDMGRMYSKYLKIEEGLSKYIEERIFEVFGSGRVLGVHARGTDFNQRLYGHPIPILPEEYFEYIDTVVDNYDLIFLATEDLNNLEKFKKRYGKRLVYHSEITRSKTAENPVFSEFLRGGVVGFQYTLGKEMMTDLVSLSRCKGIVTGLSQVGVCARILKSSYKEEYSHDILIDKGLFTDKNETMSIDDMVKKYKIKV